MATKTDVLAAALADALGDALNGVSIALGEVTAVIPPDRLRNALRAMPRTALTHAHPSQPRKDDTVIAQNTHHQVSQPTEA